MGKDPFVVIIDLGIAEMFSLSEPRGQEAGGTPATMAPEVWKKSYGPKCDVWSAGCILFELLAGTLPFVTDSMKKLAWLRLHIAGPDWSLITTSAASKALCQSMLSFNESDRPSMEECLQMEWFQLQPFELLSVPAARFAPLKDFYQQAAVKRAFMLEIASRLPMGRAQQVVEIFETFDADRDGSISMQEVQDAFKELGLGDQDLAKKTFKALDVDRSGSLSFSEMAAGILLLFRELQEEGLYALFLEHWDGEGDGLSSDGLAALLTSASDLRSTSGAKSAALLQDLQRKANRRRVRFAELRDVILGPARPPK